MTSPAWVLPALVSVRRLRLRRHAMVEGIVLVPGDGGWRPVNAAALGPMARRGSEDLFAPVMDAAEQNTLLARA